MQKSSHKNEPVEFQSTCGISYDQLQKFWDGLPRHGCRELLKLDKQTFVEQIRKKNFCSRCYGLLVEEFSRIVMLGKSSRQHGAVAHDSCNRPGVPESQTVGGLSDDQDPSVNTWGCLTTTRDGTQTLTLLDCYFQSSSIEGIQKVFESARTREMDRKLLHPFACGVGGRKWKGPASREACVVHTNRLPLENLVDFWSSQGEESRQSLLKMKEEDFVEQLTFRIDENKFCRKCRKNINQEFKEIKELTSIRKESGLHFQYEISHDTVQADWSQTFMDTHGSYSHFEWGVGSAKGKSDISRFKSVGLSKIVRVGGLDLSGLKECYINLRAWKTDGDCTELSVKAHTSMGQQYGHCRLVVGDGFVSVTEGESMLNFFKHAEEVVKEDKNLMDKKGNRLDGECSHPQRHARSPESARKFLLDAATVFFKEQIDKALREKRAHQNAHSVFVTLAVNMIEESAHVACKERHILENQFKLLEEEAKQKNEEEERKERRRNKEREKKLRRKERPKEKEKNGDNSSLTEQHLAPQVNIEDSTIVDEEPDATETVKVTSSRPVSPHFQDEKEINEYMKSNMHNSSDVRPDENFASSNSKNGSTGFDQSKCSLTEQHLAPQVNIEDSTVVDEEPDATETVKVTSSRPVSPHFQDEKEINEYMKSNTHNSPDVRPDENFASSNSKNGSTGFDQSKCSEWKLKNRHHQDTTSKSSINKQFAVVPRSGTMVNKSEKSYRDDHFDFQDVKEINEHMKSNTHNSPDVRPDENFASSNSKNGSTGFDQSKCSEWKLKNRHHQDTTSKSSINKQFAVVPRSGTMVNKSEKSYRDDHFDSSSRTANRQNKHSRKQIANRGKEPMQKQPNAADEESLKSDISQAARKGFSFFHFDGPSSLANAYEPDSLPSEDSVGGHSLVKSIHYNEGSLPSNKRDSFEEYDLFSTKKGITFSFFSK